VAQSGYYPEISMGGTEEYHLSSACFGGVVVKITTKNLPLKVQNFTSSSACSVITLLHTVMKLPVGEPVVSL
jgi:hypothetical protein